MGNQVAVIGHPKPVGSAAEHPFAVVHTTDERNGEWARRRITPTAQTYGELQFAYNYYNANLFAGQLPDCLITLQRKGLRRQIGKKA